MKQRIWLLLGKVGPYLQVAAVPVYFCYFQSLHLYAATMRAQLGGWYKQSLYSRLCILDI